MVEFADATSDQHQLLRDILIESKGHWGYSREQLEVWRSKLQFESKYIRDNTVKLMTKNAKVIGFFAITIAITKGEENMLDHLWLLPEAIGKGIGSLAFKQILKECDFLAIAEFYIVSDPDAQDFYLKKGAIPVGEVYSAAQNRMLAKLKYLVV